ncbi:DUF2357 domain-containing protein [Caryophanon latum]|uniref:DUF2357 domain-containing protein n=1 Tax=Caryophanon latum TaxID=33977 RepID=A0A1C0YV23_9BACL|nr:DUF2357 domain-containing protein [Caryophanon latum]OCS91003.1 hypothetical protein A6K76_10555 [Caryophanon latum]
MQSNIRFMCRDRWVNAAFHEHDEQVIVSLYRYEFRIEGDDMCALKTLRINDEQFHSFREHEQALTFTFMSVKENNRLVLTYELDGQQQQAAFFVHAEKALLPTTDYLQKLQQQFSKWQRNVEQYVEKNDAQAIELEAFYEDEQWQVTFEQLKAKLQHEADGIWYYVYRRDIIKHLQNILRKPKVKLISEEMLVNASELDVITPRTIEHFMKDTTTWARSALGRPVPQQLIKEVNEESIDIYENRFVYTFAYHLEREMRPILKELRTHLHTIQTKKVTNERQVMLNILREQAEYENLELNEYELFFDDVHRQLKTLYRLVRQTIQQFRELKKMNGFVQTNQVLLYNKDYNTLYRLYNKFMRARLQRQQKESDFIDYTRYYTDEVFFTIVRQLQRMQFVHDGPLHVPLSDDVTTYPFADVASFTLTHETEPIALTLHREHYTITLAILHEEQMQKTIVFVPSIVSFHRRIDDRHIDALYEYPRTIQPQEELKRKKKKEVVQQETRDVLIVYPAETADDYEQHIRYEQLHRVVTLGTNFITPEHFEQFGDMKYGVFPYTMGNATHPFFSRFMRMQLVKLGVRSHCFICGAKGRQMDNGDYVCTNEQCDSEWGQRDCQCGAPLHKMQKRSDKEDALLTEEQEREYEQQRDAVWLFHKESITAQFGLSNICENARLGTSFFTICPNCGDCKQQSKIGRICKRCDAVERCQA